MDYWLILGAVAFAAVSFLVFKLVKSALKAAGIVLSIAFVVFLVCSAVVFVDAMIFKDRFATEGKVFLLEQGNDAVAGLYVSNVTEPIPQQTLATYSDYLSSADYSGILGDRYKLIIFDTKIVGELGQLDIDNQTFPAGTVSDVFSSSDEAAKQRFFSFLIGKSFSMPSFFFEQYRKGNIIIYPETPLFKFVRYIPLSIIKSAEGGAFDKIKSAIERFV